jgi:hypothetical protein
MKELKLCTIALNACWPITLIQSLHNVIAFFCHAVARRSLVLSTVDTLALSGKRVFQNIFPVKVEFHEVLDSM